MIGTLRNSAIRLIALVGLLAYSPASTQLAAPQSDASQPDVAHALLPTIAVYPPSGSGAAGLNADLWVALEEATALTGKFALRPRARFAEMRRADPAILMQPADYAMTGNMGSLDCAAPVPGGASAGNVRPMPRVSVSIATVSNGLIASQGQAEGAVVTDLCDPERRRDAIQALARELVSRSVMPLFPLAVAAYTPDRRLVLNYGEGYVAVGQLYRVVERGEAVRDPATNEILDYQMVHRGLVRIAVTGPAQSLTEPIAESETLATIGATLERATASDHARHERSRTANR